MSYESERPPVNCITCSNNGFPGEMILLAGKDERGVYIKKNPDKTPHVHKTKLPSRQQYSYQQQQQNAVPMTPPLTGSSSNSYSKTKDEEIARMHEENMEVKRAERDLMKQDIDAKLQIAIAIKALADAIREGKLV